MDRHPGCPEVTRAWRPHSPTPQDIGPTSHPPAEPPNPYYSEEVLTLDGGSRIVEARINGPSQPIPGHDLDEHPWRPLAGTARGRNAAPCPHTTGCSAARPPPPSMVGAYFDRGNYPNIYTGPTNGGVMPMDNSVWPEWMDTPAPPTPRIHSLLHAAAWMVAAAADRSTTTGCSTKRSARPLHRALNQHTWGSAFGDYMKTSQSGYGNTDGSTYFNWWLNGSPMTCAEMASGGFAA